MYNNIQSQLLSGSKTVNEIALTGTDFKNLLTETMDRVTISLRVQEGYEGLSDPVKIDKILERQLSSRQHYLEDINDKLWDSLYWTKDLTRPDRLSKILNKVVRQDSSNTDEFQFDEHVADEETKRKLKLHDKAKFDHFRREFLKRSHVRKNEHEQQRSSDSSGKFGFMGFSLGGGSKSISRSSGKSSDNEKLETDNEDHLQTNTDNLNDVNNENKNKTISTLERHVVQELLGKVSDHILLEGDMIKPKPISVNLIKLGTLKSDSKLFSSSVLIKARTQVHTLPLRCPSNNAQISTSDHNNNNWLSEKVAILTTTVTNLTNIIQKLKDETSHREAVSNLEAKFNRLETEVKRLKTNTESQLSTFRSSMTENVAVPKGTIMLWDGDTSTVPDDWAVCDGTNGTPDLRNRYIIGSGSNAENKPGTTGGSSAITPSISVHDTVLTEAQMPKHNHGGMTDSETNRHIYYDHDSALHTMVSTTTRGSRWLSMTAVDRCSHCQHTHAIHPNGQNQPHTHGASSSTISLHPPFHALLYIMKL
ncbi:unnamed protein product [Didymodactylos carnosus]|uniref:Uncharacterized protein n=1 Tax=Didymodactylos carnosus TaxID=1234261 RepID=A0A8S2IIB1_9BILA|nr:unnamed protein product [Didymodactylos carnosus]CAF3754620.1 unnamed protein product [Didymodactylos carnosus]